MSVTRTFVFPSARAALSPPKPPPMMRTCTDPDKLSTSSLTEASFGRTLRVISEQRAFGLFSNGMAVSIYPRLLERASSAELCWVEMRCIGCGRLLQKIEKQALRRGKHIEIKCGHCKAVNDLVGTD